MDARACRVVPPFEKLPGQDRRTSVRSPSFGIRAGRTPGGETEEGGDQRGRAMSPSRCCNPATAL